MSIYRPGQQDIVFDLLAEAVGDSVITCRGCETKLEPDCPVCGICGWKNPLVERGFI